LTGGCCSEVDLVLKLLGQDLGWSLLTGGRYSEVVVSTSLTVFQIILFKGFFHLSYKFVSLKQIFKIIEFASMFYLNLNKKIQ
jgi:hypothetical protein